jgi:hypothetical protein
MSEYVHKSHNVTALLYHLVFPAKYRKVVFDDEVDDVLKGACAEIEKRPGSCSFSSAIGAQIQRDKDSDGG